MTGKDAETAELIEGATDAALTPYQYPALLRAADLIGQLADLNYMRKISALFIEFEETGMTKKLGYSSSSELGAAYPKFFGSVVAPDIADALDNLRMTQEASFRSQTCMPRLCRGARTASLGLGTPTDVIRALIRLCPQGVVLPS
jgi:hypothetical protein